VQAQVQPSHILTVYQSSNPCKKFIAKKVRKQSNELEIFKRLNTFQPKSEHIISLHESFQARSTSWAILPKMVPVTYYVVIEASKLHGKVAQVCWGLIKDVAYLHKLCIAHRDIKPDNLVVDGNFTVKMIDFDVAMQLEDEDEVVEGQCGTKSWMAPEIEEKSMYSPVKADRWSTRRVILYFPDELREEDRVLRATGKKLTPYNPEQRLSLLQVAATPSVVENVAVKGKALRFLQDAIEVDWEPPRLKKRKLTVSGRNERVVLEKHHEL
jgi:serine/threonine protein kinase